MGTKRYNKKGVRKTRNLKNKYKKTKKLRQKGGFICNAPPTQIIRQVTSKPSDDLIINTKTYENYLEECETFSKCYFTNINNLNLITEILKILNDNIGNIPFRFTYKNTPDTNEKLFSDYEKIKNELNNVQVYENEPLNSSKFLDIYLTKQFLEYYLSYYLTDCKTRPNQCNNILLTDENTAFLNNESQKFIIDENYEIIQNEFVIKLIDKLINLNNKCLIRSVLEILGTTFSNIFKDRTLFKNLVNSQVNEMNKKNVSDIIDQELNKELTNYATVIFVIKIVLTLFIFNFANYLSDESKKQNLSKEQSECISILKLIYKLFYAIYTSYNDEKIYALIETSIPKKFTIGTNPSIEIQKLPIFNVVDVTGTLSCLINNLIVNENMLVQLCDDIKIFIETKKINNYTYYLPLLKGCTTDALKQQLVREIALSAISGAISSTASSLASSVASGISSTASSVASGISSTASSTASRIRSKFTQNK